MSVCQAWPPRAATSSDTWAIRATPVRARPIEPARRAGQGGKRGDRHGGDRQAEDGTVHRQARRQGDGDHRPGQQDHHFAAGAPLSVEAVEGEVHRGFSCGTGAQTPARSGSRMSRAPAVRALRARVDGSPRRMRMKGDRPTPVTSPAEPGGGEGLGGRPPGRKDRGDPRRVAGRGVDARRREQADQHDQTEGQALEDSEGPIVWSVLRVIPGLRSKAPPGEVLAAWILTMKAHGCSEVKPGPLRQSVTHPRPCLTAQA
jgi:hypothetical protein